MSKEIIEKLKKEIEGFKVGTKAEKIGVVREVGDGVVRIWGLADAKAQEMIEIESGGGLVYAIVLNLEEDSVGAMVLGDYLLVKEGDSARSIGKVLSVPVGEELIGRVVNPLMEPIDGRGPVKKVVGKGPLAREIVRGIKKAPGHPRPGAFSSNSA